MKNRKEKESKKNASEKTEKDVCIDPSSESDLLYDVDSTPPIGIIIFYGFQIVIVNVCFCILMAMMIGQLICADYQFTSRLFSTICVLAGITTMLQTGFGARMPIFHGPSIVFILPYMFASTDPRWGCKKDSDDVSNGAIINMTSNANETEQEPWEIEWEKMTGSLMVAHVVEICVGLSGVLGLLLKVIRPITIGCIFILITIYLENVISDFAQPHWGLSIFSMLLIIIISQYINVYSVPAPYWSRKNGFHWTRFPLFELFPVLISVIVTWIFAIILTAAGAFPDDPTDIRYQARTDINSDNIRNSPVFRVPYPGQFGVSFDAEYFLVFLVSILTTVVESFGAYHQYALSCQLPRPPAHAINRGIFTEAVGGLLAASCGMGCATTSYGNMVGIIRITKVASRKVYITGGFILMVVGLFAKVGAFLCSIPKPVLAGPVFLGIAMLAGAAFANFHNTDLTRPRNQTTLGISLVVGVFLPFWINGHPEAIDTGSVIGDRTLNAFLGLPFLVGGTIACLLDCTLPGPRDDPSKAPVVPFETSDAQENDDIEKVIEKEPYNPRIRLFDPPFIGKHMRRWSISRYIAIFPNPDLLKHGRWNDEALKRRRENGLSDDHFDKDDTDSSSFKLDAETWYKLHKTNDQ